MKYLSLFPYLKVYIVYFFVVDQELKVKQKLTLIVR